MNDAPNLPTVVRVAGAHRAGRAVAGWFSVVLAVLLTQAVGVLPAVAQHAPTSTIASDTILAWGDNSFGQFGNGSTTSSSTPVAVSLPAGTTVTAIAGSDTHSLALTSAGTVLAWGGNSSGQLGNGSTADSSLPVTVNVPTGSALTGVAIHRDHAVATTSAGTALAWSRNNEGQLGDGSTTDRSTPVAVSLPAGTTLAAIAAGDDHSMALPTPQPHSTTSLRVSPQDPTADQDVTLTATVTCTTDTPTGTITFRTTTTDLTTVPLDSTTTATHTTRHPHPHRPLHRNHHHLPRQPVRGHHHHHHRPRRPRPARHRTQPAHHPRHRHPAHPHRRHPRPAHPPYPGNSTPEMTWLPNRPHRPTYGG